MIGVDEGTKKMMQAASGLQPAIANRLALTPHLRGQIALVALDSQEFEKYLENLLRDRADIDLTASSAQVLARLFPKRAALPRLAGAGLGSVIDHVASAAPGLLDHAQQQIGLMFRDPFDRQIAEDLLPHLAPTGWLEIDPVLHADEIGEGYFERMGHVVETLQGIEPAGLFARNLRECLWLQARDCDALDGVMTGVLDNLAILAQRGADALAQILKVTPAEVQRCVTLIRSFDPKPGLRFGQETIPPPEPDLIFRRLKSGWSAALNPRLSCGLASVQPSGEADVAKLGSVVEFRSSTLLKAGQWFALGQAEFLQHGVAELRPMTRRGLASALDLHETTVGRALRHRLLQTPRGMFEFDALFGTVRPRGRSRQVSEIEHGSPSETLVASPHAVRVRLKELIGAERVTSPLSDAALADELAAWGMPISRRTVAKYRAELKIPQHTARGA